MTSQITPYLHFRDDAREGMSFYQRVFGGELTMSTFEEFEMSNDPVEKLKIMHAQLIAPNGLVLMGADTPTKMDFNPGDSISIALSGDDEDLLTGYYNGLAEDGTIVEPLAKSPWGDSFGMLRDKYNVNWMVNITGAGADAAGQAPATAETPAGLAGEGNAPDNPSAPNPAVL
jgi:PhnB protein